MNESLKVTDALTYRSWQVTVDDAGTRLDVWLHNMLPEFSRGMLQRAIQQGKVQIDGKLAKASMRLRGGEKITVTVQPERPALENLPEPIALDLVHTDEALIVLNKPAGLVVHPGAGNSHGTLLNALLHAFPELISLPRAGLVHRLDKDTSGLLVVARTATSYSCLVDQLQKRQVKRRYVALCYGDIETSFQIDAPIGRNPHNRIKMAVVEKGKPAQSQITPISRFSTTSLVSVQLHTGRTHQIRVHLSHAGYPIVGDPLYSSGRSFPVFHRQALHATELAFIHPLKGTTFRWKNDMPQDMQDLIDMLEQQIQPSTKYYPLNNSIG